MDILMVSCSIFPLFTKQLLIIRKKLCLAWQEADENGVRQGIELQVLFEKLDYWRGNISPTEVIDTVLCFIGPTPSPSKLITQISNDLRVILRGMYLIHFVEGKKSFKILLLKSIIHH